MAVWLLGVAALLGARGQETSVSDRSQFPSEIVLQPETVADELEHSDRVAEPPPGPFLKEPGLSANHISRGVLHFGKDTNNAFALIWDQPKHKLSLDLNHNLDLTDDPGGVFTSTNKGDSQWFLNVTLPLRTQAGLHPARLDLEMFVIDQAKGTLVRLASRTLWQARVANKGEDWQVAVVDRLLDTMEPTAGKFLLVRPWSAHTNRVDVNTTMWGAVPVPEQLFWLGKAFRLERRFEAAGDGTVCKLALTPQQPPLAALKLSGDFLSYAMLQATNGYTLVLPGPAATWDVPQGVYAVRSVWLKRGAAEAFRRDYTPLSIDATSATNLVLGGPLTNTVGMQRYGRRLLVGHLVKGADGAEYRLVQDGWKPWPEFAVYHGGKKVFTGKFQPG